MSGAVPRSVPKPLRAMVGLALHEGWKIKLGRHIKLYSPDGATILTLSRSPSDHRVVHKVAADLRRDRTKEHEA